MGFLRILLIFALLYFAVRLIGRLLFPPQRSSYDNGNSRPEGDVSFDNKGTRSKKVNKDEGDYIDYEEIK